jgi:hypothetical protein
MTESEKFAIAFDNIIMYELVDSEIVQYTGSFGRTINHTIFVGYTLGSVDLDWF